MSTVQLKGRASIESRTEGWLNHFDFLPSGKHGRVVDIALRILIDLCPALRVQDLVETFLCAWLLSWSVLVGQQQSGRDAARDDDDETGTHLQHEVIILLTDGEFNTGTSATEHDATGVLAAI